MLRIDEVDLHDRDALTAYWEVEQVAQRHDRAHPVLRTLDALAMVGEPQPYYRHLLLAARDGDTTVGVADIGLALTDNEHLADVEIDVAPDRRREGIGTALYDELVARCRDLGRTTVVAEVSVPHDGDPEQTPGYAFAQAQGLTSAQVQVHLTLELPAAPPVAPVPDGYEVVMWRERCPDEFAAAYCAMVTQMSHDHPTGEVDVAPVVFDEERLRTSESRTTRLYDPLVAAVRAGDGSFVGYTKLYLAHGTEDVIQDDTLVMPAHRGHRLGHVLKLATLQVVQEEYPERTTIHTWCDQDNAPILATNHSFGYQPVESTHGMQRRL